MHVLTRRHPPTSPIRVLAADCFADAQVGGDVQNDGAGRGLRAGGRGMSHSCETPVYPNNMSSYLYLLAGRPALSCLCWQAGLR